MRKPVLRLAAAALAMAALAAASLSAAAQTPAQKSTGIICWSDKNGRQVGCGYTVPPEYANNPTRELNSRGVTVRRTDPVATGEALRRKQEDEAQRKLEEQERQLQRQRDLALINSYTSEREIDARRDRDVQQLELTILGLATHLKQLRSGEADIRRRIEGFSKASRPIPENLMEDLQRASSEAASVERMIAQKRNEQEGVRAKYNELRTRYIELTRQDTARR